MAKGTTKIVLLLVFLGLLFAPATSGANVEHLERGYVIKQLGNQIGTAHIQLNIDHGDTHLNTIVNYPSLGVEVTSEYLFTGSDFPKTPVSYGFSIMGGILDVEMSWGKELSYTINPQSAQGSIPETNVLALDNNIITDYMTATWLYDLSNPQLHQSSLVLPTQMAAGLVPMSMQFIGEEVVGHYQTDHFQVNIGVVIDLWVDHTNRSLIKLHIPMQAYEIIASDLEEEIVSTKTFKDFGGLDFHEEEITCPIQQGTLSGTLSIPKIVDQKMPGVVLVAGSGPTDRDGNSYLMPGPADYLKEIAHYLASRGIVILRYDKRGVGLSQGPVTSFNDFISDVSTMVDALKAQAVVNNEQIYIFGHSEGAWLASEVALLRQDLAGIGLLAGAGYPYFDTIKRQLTTQADTAIAMGMFDEGLTKRIAQALDDMYQAILNQQPYDVSNYQLPDEFNQVINSFVFQADLIKQWLVTDPAQVLSKVDVPVLIVQGTGDIQIDVADAHSLAGCLPDDQVKLHIIEGIDHIMKMTYGEPLSYVDPNRRVEPAVLQILENWILK